MSPVRLHHVFGLALTLSVVLTFPLALHLDDHALDGAYWGNQAWSVRVVADAEGHSREEIARAHATTRANVDQVLSRARRGAVLGA